MPEQEPNQPAHRPTVADVDPSVLAVDSLPDETRMHGNADETEAIQSNSGDLMPVAGEHGDHVDGRLDDGPVQEVEDTGETGEDGQEG
ncbi:MAG: hypothetical protein ACR2KL_10255 [Nocardioidaceae bacterium]